MRDGGGDQDPRTLDAAGAHAGHGVVVHFALPSADGPCVAVVPHARVCVCVCVCVCALLTCRLLFLGRDRIVGCGVWGRRWVRRAAAGESRTTRFWRSSSTATGPATLASSPSPASRVRLCPPPPHDMPAPPQFMHTNKLARTHTSTHARGGACWVYWAAQPDPCVLYVLLPTLMILGA
jgi:hypothetical protein